METKNDKFKRLINQRMPKLLDEMRKITNLATPSYESTGDERRKIVSALRTAVEEIEYTFAGEKPDKRKFKWGDAPVEETSDEESDD